MNDVNNDLSEYLIELNREVLDANVNLQYFEHVVSTSEHNFALSTNRQIFS